VLAFLETINVYLSSSMACDLPNSGTPMPQSAIDDQNAYVAAVGAHFVDGDNVLGALIQALGGNRVDATTGDAGIPTVGVPYFDPSTGLIIGGGPGGGSGVPGAGSPLPGAPGTRRHGRAFWIYRRNARLFGGGVEGGGQPLGVPGALLAARRAANMGPTCNDLPQPMPLMTVFPSAPIVPAAAPAPPAPAAAPAPPAPAAPVRYPAIPSTGNVCADLTLGLLTKDQVSVDQMRYCSVNGYQGANVPPSWVTREQIRQTMAGTLPKIPFQASPPNTDMRGYPTQYLPFFQSLFTSSDGLSGVPSGGDMVGTSPVLFWGALLAGAGLLYYASQKKRR
jgi:hypothetical protein